MSPFLQCLLIFAVFSTRADSRLVSKILVFSKQQQFVDNRVLLSQPKGAVTENDSFLYGVCDTPRGTFEHERCNVTIETPAFENATYRQTCVLNFTSGNLYHETFADLQLHTFGDDRALLSWVVRDQNMRTKLSQIRILRLSDCKSRDISVPSEVAHNIVTYENAFDVIVRNRTFCKAAENCKVTFDAEGKKVHGPTPYLANVKNFMIIDILPDTPQRPVKGTFVHAYTNDTAHETIFLVGPDGKGIEIIGLRKPRLVHMSNAHGAFAACWTSAKNNITCRQYSAKLEPKLNVDFDFFTEPSYHSWIQPHNLRDGGLLLVTGTSAGSEPDQASLTIIKVNADGRKERPLIIEGLDLQCFSNIYVSVSENEEDEFCFHFTCQRDLHGDQGLTSRLQLEARCLPKKYASIPKRRASVAN